MPKKPTKQKDLKKEEEDRLLDQKSETKQPVYEEIGDNQNEIIESKNQKIYFEEETIKKIATAKKPKQKKQESESVSEIDSEEERLKEEQDEKKKKEKLEKKMKKLEKKKEIEEKLLEQQQKQQKKLEQIKRRQQEEDDELEEDLKDKKKSSFWDNFCILTFLGISLLFMAYMKYEQSIYNKTNKISAGKYSDLYQVLEVDANSSMLDIRRSYKKLAIKWHPDKNTDCFECEEKFQMILKAYEVLGKESSRLEYDQTRGVTNAIKSRAVQLTARNFEQFVLESNDVWILQVYENNNKFCEQMGPFWESTVEKFGHLVQFGRINRETDPELLRYLPLNVQIVPTILSYINGGEDYKLYTFDRMNPENGMHKFVAESIQTKVNIFDSNQSLSMVNKLNQYSQQNDIIDVVYISTVSKMPIEYKYAAFKYSDSINFHVSKYGQRKKIQDDFQTQDNLLIYYNDDQKQERKSISFRMPKKFDNGLFRKVLKLAKFMSVPKIDRSSFKDFCEASNVRFGGNDNVSEDNNDDDFIQSDSALCFVINTQDSAALKEIKRIRQDILNDVVKEFKQSKGQKLFENYAQIQFVEIDLKTHWKWQQSLTELKDNQAPLDTSLIYALQPESRKISFQQNLLGIEDWILDLVDNESNSIEYLNEYLSEENKVVDISQMLKYNKDTPFNLIYKGFMKYKTDWKVLMTVILIFASLQFMNKGKKTNKDYILYLSFVIYVFLIVLFVYIDNFEEFHH